MLFYKNRSFWVKVKSLPYEAFIWLTGLAALAVFDADIDRHFAICPLSYLGFDFCPGCGLGRSISYFFHGKIAQSLQVHPLGIFAVIVLSLRIIKLLKPYFNSHGKNH